MKNTISYDLGLLGVGTLMRCVLGRLQQQKFVGSLYGSARTDATCSAISTIYNIPMTSDNQDLFDRSSTVLIGVKPDQMSGILQNIIPRERQMIISLAAGISHQQMRDWLTKSGMTEDVKIVRCMLNTAASIGESSNVLMTDQPLTSSEKETVDRLFAYCGQSFWVSDTAEFDFATTVTGCGPAYFFYFAECLADVLHHRGLPKDVAMHMAKQTLYGSGALAAQSSDSLQVLRESVTTPKGVTAAAMVEFQKKLPSLTDSAITAALNRCSTVSEEHVPPSFNLSFLGKSTTKKSKGILADRSVPVDLEDSYSRLDSFLL